jgi:hypothetical protein
MAFEMTSSVVLVRDYLRQWVKTASSHIDIEFASSVVDPFDRMRLICNECHQTLTCDVPETPEKIDWALQKFVGLHKHDPAAEAKLVKEFQDRMNALKVTLLTVDFKPARVGFAKEGRRFRETN